MKNEHDANLALQRSVLSPADRRACESIRRHRAFKDSIVRAALNVLALAPFAALGVLLAWRG